MASRKFRRKIEEVAAQAGTGAAAKVGGWSRAAEVAREGKSRLRIDEFFITCTPRMRKDGEQFAELASRA